MTVEKTKGQMDGFHFPTVEEQLNDYFNDGGRAISVLSFMGKMFGTDAAPALDDYSGAIDSSFLQ